MMSLPAIVMQMGILAVAAVLWIDARREERRRRLVESLAATLREDALRRPTAGYFTRAA